MAEMTGRVCLVTGATHGIGKATAEALARMGATLVVHGRSPERVDEVCRGIRARTHNDAVSGITADYESLDEVRRMAEVVRTTHPRLHVLVNNAGGSRRPYQRTRDGFEWHFGVNHLAPFLLTRLLLDTLTASAPARVVLVSSEAHRRSRIDLDDLNFERGYGTLAAYGRSKSANILFTVELANRLRGTGVTANALHPGVVRTNIFDQGGWLAQVFDAVGRGRREDTGLSLLLARRRQHQRPVLHQVPRSHAQPVGDRSRTGPTAVGTK
jgi:NAD(P)-dependent dehydrogenase (short-subunit alcohol dehydrogenase family)